MPQQQQPLAFDAGAPFGSKEWMLDRQFCDYDERNPEVWQMFVKLARQAIDAGRSHYSAKTIIEVIRHHTMVSGDDSFKINNNWTARYARKFMRVFPSHAGFFALREPRYKER